MTAIHVMPGAGTAWAWSGVRLAPASGLAATRAYSDLPESRRWDDARRAEAAWLAAQLGGWQAIETRPVFAMRYVNLRGDGLLDGYLLWRADGFSAAEAAAAAARVGERLTAVPRHIQAVPFDTAAEVQAALRPFDPHSAGLAEIRKRLTAARCTRADTGRGLCLAVAPFGTETRSWEPLWAALADSRTPVMATVVLSPYDADPRLATGLNRLAGEYQHLASPGKSATAVYDKPLAPDMFAVRAAPLYAEAARRYAGAFYTCSITLASADPLPPLLAETFAGLVAQPGQAPPAVLRPTGDEMPTMWGNISMLNMDQLAVSAYQGVPEGALGPVERVLARIADVPEAAALFRMPYAIPGHLPLFRGLPEPPPGFRPAVFEPESGTAGAEGLDSEGAAPGAESPGPQRDPWLSRFLPGGSR